jgi:hypothetical protein
MSAKIFSGCLVVGLALLTAGVAWRFSIAVGLIACGAGTIVLTFLTLLVAGRRNVAE